MTSIMLHLICCHNVLIANSWNYLLLIGLFTLLVLKMFCLGKSRGSQIFVKKCEKGDPLLIKEKSLQYQWGSIMRNMYIAAILVTNNGFIFPNHTFFAISYTYLGYLEPLHTIYEADCEDFG